MDPITVQDAQLLTALRRRRAELSDSMSAVERALADPAHVRGTDWAARVRFALVRLSGDFREHIAITEGPEGLYREIEQNAPRLIAAIDRLTREHAEISRRIEELLAGVEADAITPAERVRRSGTDLLAVLMRHRQRGADLVFEAYQIDVGGET